MRKTEFDYVFERGSGEDVEYVVFLRMGDTAHRRECYHRSEWEEKTFASPAEANAFIEGLDAGLNWYDCKLREELSPDEDDVIYAMEVK